MQNLQQLQGMTPEQQAALQQQYMLQQQQYYLQQQQLYQQQLQYAQGQGAMAAAARGAGVKKSKPVPAKITSSSRRPSQRTYSDDDSYDDDDEFEDYSHLLAPAEREMRKKRRVGTGDRSSDDDYFTPSSGSSSSESESSSSEEDGDEEEESDSEEDSDEEHGGGRGGRGYGGDGEVSPSRRRKREEKANNRRSKKDEYEEEAGSDIEKKKKKKKEKGEDSEKRAAATTAFLKTIEVPLRRQVLRFFNAVMVQYQINTAKDANDKAAIVARAYPADKLPKPAVPAGAPAGTPAPAPVTPQLPAIAGALAYWPEAAQQRIAFCELLSLCPIESKQDKPEPYHYLRPTCIAGINFYCTFQPDRAMPPKSPMPPAADWIKRFEDRVKQWFALEPIGQFMNLLPAVTEDEDKTDKSLAAAVQAAHAGTVTALPGATVAAGDKKEKEKKKKKKNAESDSDGPVSEPEEDDEVASAWAKRGNSGVGARKRQKKDKYQSATSAQAPQIDSDTEDQKGAVAVAAAAAGIAPAPAGLPAPQPALPSSWRTLFLQQLDISLRRTVLRLIASSVPQKLGGKVAAYSQQFGQSMVALTLRSVCELANVSPKPYDAKSCEIQVKNYFAFLPAAPIDSVQLPTPTFVVIFQKAVRDWLAAPQVSALLMSPEFFAPATDADTAEDQALTAAQAEARAQPLISFAFTVPGSAEPPVASSGPA